MPSFAVSFGSRNRSCLHFTFSYVCGYVLRDDDQCDELYSRNHSCLHFTFSYMCGYVHRDDDQCDDDNDDDDDDDDDSTESTDATVSEIEFEMTELVFPQHTQV